MSDPTTPETPAAEASGSPQAPVGPPPPSFIKLAMRNMVRKGRQSLMHFGLTAVGLLAFLVFLAWLGRPIVPH
jgi:hypothetical protein